MGSQSFFKIKFALPCAPDTIELKKKNRRSGKGSNPYRENLYSTNSRTCTGHPRRRTTVAIVIDENREHTRALFVGPKKVLRDAMKYRETAVTACFIVFERIARNVSRTPHIYY